MKKLLKKKLGLLHPREFAEDRENFIVHMRKKQIADLEAEIERLKAELKTKKAAQIEQP